MKIYIWKNAFMYIDNIKRDMNGIPWVKCLKELTAKLVCWHMLLILDGNRNRSSNYDEWIGMESSWAFQELIYQSHTHHYHHQLTRAIRVSNLITRKPRTKTFILFSFHFLARVHASFIPPVTLLSPNTPTKLRSPLPCALPFL